ncbi:MAG: carotenoid biosynthesis protein, partial [Gemmatimonadetes bacterium]|nr:carotenoid biosynthesis protein [Gemmatimonadota bacterium]
VGVCGVALTAEWLGTSTGFPFGEYRYTELLGPRIDGKVPWLIPASWFLMALPSFALAVERKESRLSQWLLGAVLLTAWDFSLDPAMSYLSPYWVWEGEGVLYGMPLLNVAGWLVTAFVIMAVLDWTGSRRVVEALPRGFLAGYYLAVLGMSFGMVLVGGLWISVALTIPVIVWIGSQWPSIRARTDVSGLAHAGSTS